jgi:hypothetical protein
MVPEALEPRTLLAYTFNFNPVTMVATAVSDGSNNDSLTIDQSAGFIDWSVNGSLPSSNWGGFAVPNAATVVVDITQASGGTGEIVTLGSAVGPISTMAPTFSVGGNPAGSSTFLNDTTGTTPAVGADAYSYDGFTAHGPNGFTAPIPAIESDGVNFLGSNQDDTYNIPSTFSGEPVNIFGGASINTVNLGSNPGTPSLSTLGGISSLVSVSDLPGFATLNLFDAGDTGTQPGVIDAGTVTGLGFGSGGSVAYAGGPIGGVTPLNIFGGTDGIFGTTYTVNNTSSVTNLVTGSNNDTVDVLGTGSGAPLTLDSTGGFDIVNIGNAGSVAGIFGAVTVNNSGGFSAINVNAFADLTGHDATLSGVAPADLTGVAPTDIFYTASEISSLSISMGDAGLSSNNLTIDFSTGNPIPTFAGIGLVYDSGFGLNNTLNLQGDLPPANGGPGFFSETHNANDPTVFPQNGQYGSIDFVDELGVASAMTYTGLTPINDTANAVNYTFNDFGDNQSFTASDGPTVLGFNTIQFSNTPPPPTLPTFETTNIANKNFVTFNTTTTAGVNGVVNITTPSTGLVTLTFNMNTDGDNQINVVNTPPTVFTSVTGGSDEDTANVAGLGIATGTILAMDGGGGQNTLTFDAGGLTPVILPGFAPGELLIFDPGFGTLDATNYQTINIINSGPASVTITPGPAATINTIEGFQNVNAIVGTFTVTTDPAITTSAGFPASDFTASIDWGDPSVDASAGTVTQDASNPSVYYITGTHTFVDTGTYTVANSVAFAGASVSTVINGVNISITFPPSTVATDGTPATANVTQGPLALSVFPIVGTEGLAIGPAPIATFIDGGGADPVADYSASITVFDASGAAVVSIPSAGITQNADAAQFTVQSPGFTLPQEGTYQVVVSVTDDASANPITVDGASLAVIADADLSAGAAVLLAPNTGVPLPSSTVVGSFSDANPAAPLSDFSATIDWGDGSPNSLGTITQPGGVGTPFDVTGGHTYAKPGVYTITTNVVDDGGETVTLLASATVTDLPVTGATRNFTTVEGQNTGTFVLATFSDPNTLATVANENATLAVGGWGDTTPSVAGITLTVQQIGVDPATRQPLFEVLGSHTYAEETPAGLPNTLSVIITTLGGTVTTLTSPPGGGVTVLDARLTSSNGTEITGIEGIATATTTLLGTFTDANQGSTVADFLPLPMPGGNGGSVVVDWGDGSLPQTLDATNLAAVGSPDGVIYTVTAPHTYPEAGTFAYTVTVTDDGGAVTIFSGSTIIADAALSPSATQPTVSTTEATIFPVPVFGAPVFSGPVGAFTDGNLVAPISDFTVTIDWGDGTPQSAGTVSQPGLVGTDFIVSGRHTYADSGVNGGAGSYPITIYVLDDDGNRVTLSNTANVLDVAINLTGGLNPASDSGLSTKTPNVTNVTQPNFSGTSEPFSHISLFATAAGGSPVAIGQVQAGSDGSWSITSSAVLADGTYNITATATDQFGVTKTAAPVTIDSGLVIDTVAPVITSVFFNRLNGEVDYVIEDPAPASGVYLAGLLDSSNYLFTKVHPGKAFPGKWIVTNITTAPGATPNSVDVAVQFNGGAIIPGGFYLFTIRDSSNGNSSVQDLAENHLDGVFYGSFPSGNGVNGSDFVAMLSGFHNRIFAPQTIIGTANAGNGGAGGLPVGAVHSGVWTPAVPVGGGSVFGGDPINLHNHQHHAAKGHKAAKAKTHVVVQGHHAAAQAKHKLVTSGSHPKGPHS